MNDNKCIKCNNIKPLDAFYKSKSHSIGYNNTCKCCKRLYRKENYRLNMTNELFVFSERERARKKYCAKGIKHTYSTKNNSKHKKYRDKYPEKRKAHDSVYKSKLINKNGVFHHWNYNKEFWRDVIDLSIKDHAIAHKNIVYDQKNMMYRKVNCNTLLSTKEEHLEWIMKCINKK